MQGSTSNMGNFCLEIQAADFRYYKYWLNSLVKIHNI